MKISEVCRETGLTKRTVRFYAEKGLITPEPSDTDARQRYSYSESDVETLKTVASLRRSMFSIEQIKSMLDDPGAIPEVWSEYLSGLKEVAELVTSLLEYARRADSSGFSSAGDVAKSLEPASRSMPMPNVDLNPHFARFDTPEFKESADTAERTRQQYAQRKFLDTTAYTSVGPTPGVTNVGTQSPMFHLGTRTSEFFPKSRLANRIILVLCLLFFALIAVMAIGRLRDDIEFSRMHELQAEYSEKYFEKCSVTYNDKQYKTSAFILADEDELVSMGYAPVGELSLDGDIRVDDERYAGCVLYASEMAEEAEFLRFAITEDGKIIGYIMCSMVKPYISQN